MGFVGGSDAGIADAAYSAAFLCIPLRYILAQKAAPYATQATLALGHRNE